LFSQSSPIRVLSGIQPTGSLHLGNYLGALKQWVEFQNVHESFFCVVDLHAITVPQNPKKLREETLQSAAIYLASGIDPEKSRIFIQSHVSAHSELAWILNCITPMSWLERMIQYKEKSAKHGETVGVGLFDYPVLMAADILLYKAQLVPVGDDQVQHLELTRDLARRFNEKYCKSKPILFEPKPLIVSEGARIMSLQDGTSKMSKSAENDFSRINLLDPPDVIAKKIKRCKTDTFIGLEWDNPGRPESQNLLSIYQCVTGKTKEDISKEVASMNWGNFKVTLSDAVIAHLQPIQTRYHEIMKNRDYLETVLRKGQADASAIADQTLSEVKNAVGFFSLR
jgi:tryptophanyl-tRNA synthetase